MFADLSSLFCGIKMYSENKVVVLGILCEQRIEITSTAVLCDIFPTLQATDGTVPATLFKEEVEVGSFLM